MPTVTWDHVHLRSPDPEAMAAWLEDILGGEIIRGPGRIDVKLGGAMVFIAPVASGDGVHAPPVTPYQGLDHFGLTVKDIDAVAAENVFKPGRGRLGIGTAQMNVVPGHYRHTYSPSDDFSRRTGGLMELRDFDRICQL